MLKRVFHLSSFFKSLNLKCYSQRSQGISNQMWEKIKIDETFSRAYLASQIIRIIKSPKQPIEQISLHSQIIKFIESQNQLSASSKNALKNIFLSGVQLPNEVFPQQRFKYAQDATYNKKTVFFPTTLVTSPIFINLCEAQASRLLNGHFGISKSYASILFQKLSNFIVQYKFQAENPFQSQQILQKVPKVLYWVIELAKDINIQNLQQNFVNQFTEQQLNYFKKFHPKKYQKILQNKLFLLQKYYRQRGLSVILIVDQINKVISKVRTIDYTSYDLEAKSESKQSKYIFTTLKNFEKFLCTVIERFDCVIYLSSINIEQFLLKNIKLSPYWPQFQLLSFQIEFGTKLHQIKYQFQIIDYFIFQFGQILKLKDKFWGKQWHKDSQNLIKRQKIRQQLIKFIKELDFFYLNQLEIRKHFAKLKNSSSQIHVQRRQLINNIQNQEQLTSFLKDELNEILREQMIISLREKAERFFNNDPETKIGKCFLLFNISYLIDQMTFDDKKKSTSILTLTQQDLKYFKLNFNHLRNGLDKHLFKIDQGKNGQAKLRFIVPPQIILNLKSQITQQNNAKSLVQYANDQILCITVQTLQKYISNNAGYGIIVQQAFKYALLDKSRLIKFNISSVLDLSFNNMLEQVNYFQSIQDDAKNYEFINIYLKKSLQKIVNKSNQLNKKQICSLLLPKGNINKPSKNKSIYQFFNQQKNPIYHKKNIQLTNQIDEKSKAVDLMIVKFEKQLKKFTFYAFDVTISKNYDKIYSKFKKFIKSYAKFGDQDKIQCQINGISYQIQLIYCVLGPKEANFRFQNNKQSSNMIELSKLLNYNSNTSKIAQKNMISNKETKMMQTQIKIINQHQNQNKSQEIQLKKDLEIRYQIIPNPYIVKVQKVQSQQNKKHLLSKLIYLHIDDHLKLFRRSEYNNEQNIILSQSQIFNNILSIESQEEIIDVSKSRKE